MAEEHSIGGEDHTWVFPLSVDGHVGCLHLLAAVGTAAANMDVHGSPCFQFFGAPVLGVELLGRVGTPC